MVEFFDLDAVASYAVKLGSALTAARVGFFLEQHREALMVEDKHLEPLRCPRTNVGGSVMRLTANELAREAAATGFQTEPLEKVILLLELLEAIRSHPFLKERVVLKGGTALNLFRFNVPRLSVDIDLNYIGAVDREGMLADRPKFEQALQAVCGRLGVQPRRVPSDHAGGKWRLNFNRVAGGTSTLEMDVNFLLRTPLWPVERIGSRPVGTFQATDVPVLDIHELAAGKLAALLSRTASRDLFDASQLLRGGGLDAAK